MRRTCIIIVLFLMAGCEQTRPSAQSEPVARAEPSVVTSVTTSPTLVPTTTLSQLDAPASLGARFYHYEDDKYHFSADFPYMPDDSSVDPPSSFESSTYVVTNGEDAGVIRYEVGSLIYWHTDEATGKQTVCRGLLDPPACSLTGTLAEGYQVLVDVPGSAGEPGDGSITRGTLIGFARSSCQEGRTDFAGFDAYAEVCVHPATSDRQALYDSYVDFRRPSDGRRFVVVAYGFGAAPAFEQQFMDSFRSTG